MSSKLKFFSVIFSVLFIWGNSYAQNSDTVKISKNQITSCEYIKNALDYSLIDSKKLEGSSLIILLHSGENESKNINESREKFIKKYLNFRNPNFSQIVFAQGERNTQLGKAEIYIGGKLEWKFFFRKNKTGWNSCVE
jgi:hypothetical protein